MITFTEEKIYREAVSPGGMFSVNIRCKETDIMFYSSEDIGGAARGSVLRHRRQIEEYAEKDRAFKHSLHPVRASKYAPPIVADMCACAESAGVGPMACVAGAIAHYAGTELCGEADEIIIENGGDIFIKSGIKRHVGIYAGDSAFSGKLVLEVESAGRPMGVCTSSGSVGHSLNFGCADAVVVCSDSAVMADAAATAASNMVRTAGDIERAIDYARLLEGITGVLVLAEGRLGVWGGVKIRGV